MKPDKLSALAEFDLLEMMFKSGVIAGRPPRDAHLRDRLMRSFAMPFAASSLSQTKVTFSRSGWRPQGVPNSKRGT